MQVSKLRVLQGTSRDHPSTFVEDPSESAGVVASAPEPIPRWSVVGVAWEDAHGADDGWQDPDEMPSAPLLVTSVGMLGGQSPEGLTLALTRTRTLFSAYIFIPYVCIRNVDVLAPPREVGEW